MTSTQKKSWCDPVMPKNIESVTSTRVVQKKYKSGKSVSTELDRTKIIKYFFYKYTDSQIKIFDSFYELKNVYLLGNNDKKHWLMTKSKEEEFDQIMSYIVTATKEASCFLQTFLEKIV